MRLVRYPHDQNIGINIWMRQVQRVQQILLCTYFIVLGPYSLYRESLWLCLTIVSRTILVLRDLCMSNIRGDIAFLTTYVCIYDYVKKCWSLGSFDIIRLGYCHPQVRKTQRNKSFFEISKISMVIYGFYKLIGHGMNYMAILPFTNWPFYTWLCS